MLPAEIDLAVSRLFDLGGYRPLGHTARPGSAPLDDQLAAIPRGRWTLRDDDRSTGATVRFVTEHLPAGVTLAATTFALDPDASADGDIADSRDFLLGTDDGGLVVALPGGDDRPRALPAPLRRSRRSAAASPAPTPSRSRSRCGTSTPRVFAPTDLTVADLPPAAARTMAAAGFAPDTPLADVARHHAAVLRTFVARD